MTSFKPLLSIIPFLCLSGITHGQTDDFNDGDDAGWTRLDPLGQASYAFPDGTYQLQAPASPVPSVYGPSRAAAFRQEVSYSGSLFLSVDLIITDLLLQQSMGFLAFVQPNPALGAVSGYSLSFQPVTLDIVLNRITGEVPTRLARADLQDFDIELVRLVLIAENGNFSAALYKLDDLVNPIARLSASDSVYTSGTAGVFAYADTDDATGPIDAVFDNYRANPLSLPELSLQLVGNDGFQLTWPDWAVHFSPTFSTTLDAVPWERIPVSTLETGTGVLFHNGDRTLAPRKFFRLERRPL